MSGWAYVQAQNSVLVSNSHSVLSSASLDNTMDSDRSSASVYSVLGTDRSSSLSLDGVPQGTTTRQLSHISQAQLYQPMALTDLGTPLLAPDTKPASGGMPPAIGVRHPPGQQRHPKQGYRKLWALVHSLQPGERLRSSGHREEVSVS